VRFTHGPFSMGGTIGPAVSSFAHALRRRT
jgi:hypothetical protein